MEDDKSTNSAADDAQASEDTSTTTSTEDTSQDTDVDDISLEDLEVTEEEIGDDDTEEEESSNDTSEDVKEDTEPDSEEESSEEEVDAAEQKRLNDEHAKQRIAEREARQKQREIAQAQEDVRLEQYLLDAKDDDAMFTKRQAEVERYLLQRERVSMNTEKLQVSLEKAVSGIDLFREGSPEVKEELIRAADEFERLYIEKDQYGDPVAVHGDLYQFLQDKADSIRRIQGVGARQAVKDRATTKSKTMQVPGRAPKKAVDQDLEDFDKGWN